MPTPLDQAPTLDALAELDPNASLENSLGGLVRAQKQQLDEYQRKMGVALADANQLADCNLLPKACIALLAANKANELREPLNNVMDRTVELFSNSSVPSPAVRAELDRILADDSVGLYKPAAARFFMKNRNAKGPTEIVTTFG